MKRKTAKLGNHIERKIYDAIGVLAIELGISKTQLIEKALAHELFKNGRAEFADEDLYKKQLSISRVVQDFNLKRTKLGVSVRDAAFQIGISWQHLYDIMSGRYKPSDAVLDRLSRWKN